jgi:hypothetical protein
MIAQLELEVAQLLAKAEQADATPLQDGLTIPEEITRLQERKAALAQARAEIEARAQARYAVQLAEHEAKLAARAAKKERGEKVGGQPPTAPTSTPAPGDQYNFTDPESRIMKAGNENHFEQSYNAQAAVDVASRLIVGQRDTVVHLFSDYDQGRPMVFCRSQTVRFRVEPGKKNESGSPSQCPAADHHLSGGIGTSFTRCRARIRRGPRC